MLSMPKGGGSMIYDYQMYKKLDDNHQKIQRSGTNLYIRDLLIWHF